MIPDLNWKIKLAKQVISTAFDKWQPDIVIAATGRKDSTVLIHLIKTTVDKLPNIMFIDHGYHFRETLENIKSLEKYWDLRIDYITPASAIKTSKEKLQNIITKFKIESIEKYIKDNKCKALFSAIRWDEQIARQNEIFFSRRPDHYRIHPLLHFTEEDIWQYIRSQNLPYNPLYDLGYRSIGEKPFTKKEKNLFMPERAGRNKDKEEIMGRLRSMGYF